MKHIHHIIPKHMGGTDNPSNLVELTVLEHAQAHKELYEKYGKTEDLCAYYMLSGKNLDPEFVKARASLGGLASYKKRKSAGLEGNDLVYGRTTTPEELYKNRAAGGKTQGKRNAESGHLKRIASLPNPRSAGKQWITDGVNNRMIVKDSEIPYGFRLGKTQKR